MESGMQESLQQPDDKDIHLDQIVNLAENAAETIERLRSELHRRDQRIRQLEQAEAQLRQAAQRYLRMKAQLEAQSEAKAGFAANGTIYQTFDEAFDAAYPGTVPE
ncbi:hypothetical protein [Noviherbaspirillum autotrophicum]|nr:hypothetical protein [Noviherbaspirillum autotrophicum]